MNKVIILHGWTKALEKWQPLLNELKEKRIKTDLPEIPGLTKNLERAWDIQDYVKWLNDIVDKEKDKIVLVGHSNGGRISIAFANQYPEKVKKLILIDSAGIHHHEFPHRIKLLVFNTIAKIGKKITSSKTMEDILYKLAREGDYKKSSSIMKQTMINLLNSNKNLNISNIAIPTLIIWGENDNVTPLLDGKLMNNLIKNSRMEVIKGARHSPQYTHPLEVANLIINELKV